MARPFSKCSRCDETFSSGWDYRWHFDIHIDEWWDWALENHLSKIFASREYDVCIVNYTWLSKALEFAQEKTGCIKPVSSC